MTSEVLPVLVVTGPARVVHAVAAADDAAVLADAQTPGRLLVDGLGASDAEASGRLLACHPAVASVLLAWSVAVRVDPDLADVRRRLRQAAVTSVVVDDPGLGRVEHVIFPTAQAATDAVAALACPP